jgi:hypothetical protein
MGNNLGGTAADSLREPYACRGEKREENAHVQNSAHIRSFWWSGRPRPLQLFMVNFYMETLGAVPLLFC